MRELQAQKKILVTTLFSVRQAPKKALDEVYQQRWHIELDLRNLKTTLGIKTLSCKTREMNEKEMWVYLLAYNLTRLLMAKAALQADLLPRQLCFKHSLKILVVWSQRQFISSDEENTTQLFLMMATLTVGNRPGRTEPRTLKRRLKPYPLLTKPRHQAREDVKKHCHAKKLK